MQASEDRDYRLDANTTVWSDECEQVRLTKVAEEVTDFENEIKAENADQRRSNLQRQVSRNLSMKATARNQRQFLKFGRGRKGVR